jgi:hypothetical protein
MDAVLKDVDAAVSKHSHPPRSIHHTAYVQGLPFGAGLEVDGVGAAPLPVTDDARVLQQHASTNASEVQCWPASAFRFHNPGWKDTLASMSDSVKVALQLPQVRWESCAGLLVQIREHG